MSAEHRLSASGGIEAQAAQWIERRDFGGWTDADKEALEIWLAQSLAHRVAYDRLDLGWQRTERLTALRYAKPLRDDRNPVGRGLLFLRRASMLAAASAAALAAWFAFSTDKQMTYATSVGGREIIRMVDGTQIELNTDTIVRIADNPNRREVWLDKGEAYFQVTHDASHPFVVNAGSGRVTDLGTKFSVRRTQDRLRVAVSEGGVRLVAESNTGDQRSVVLTEGEVALATPTKLSVEKEDKLGLTNELTWRSGILAFHHTRLVDAAAKFNRYNHRQIAIADNTIANLEIGGTFPTTDIEGFAEVSRDVLHLRVTRDGETIRISR